MAFNWWADAGMTVPLTRLDFLRAESPVPVDGVAYFGNPIAGTKLQRASSPGAAPLQVAVADTTPGSGVEVANIRLASTPAGLASAVAGAALNIGSTLPSGVAVAVYVRLTSSLAAVGNYDDVSLGVGDRLETAE